MPLYEKSAPSALAAVTVSGRLVSRPPATTTFLGSSRGACATCIGTSIEVLTAC
jgi:hypothetical protein